MTLKLLTLILILTFFLGLFSASWASTDRRKGVVFKLKKEQSQGIVIKKIKKNRGTSWARKWKLRDLNISMGDWFYGH